MKIFLVEAGYSFEGLINFFEGKKIWGTLKFYSYHSSYTNWSHTTLIHISIWADILGRYDHQYYLTLKIESSNDHLPMAALSGLVATPLASWAILDVALASSLIAFSSRLRESWSSLSARDLSACIRSLVASTSAFACLRISFLSVIRLCVCERQCTNC